MFWDPKVLASSEIKPTDDPKVLASSEIKPTDGFHQNFSIALHLEDHDTKLQLI